MVVWRATQIRSERAFQGALSTAGTGRSPGQPDQLTESVKSERSSKPHPTAIRYRSAISRSSEEFMNSAESVSRSNTDVRIRHTYERIRREYAQQQSDGGESARAYCISDPAGITLDRQFARCTMRRQAHRRRGGEAPRRVPRASSQQRGVVPRVSRASIGVTAR